MRISRERLLADAAQSGYRPEILEKVIQLLGLLEGLSRHPYLKDRLALKGGTALNLFIFNLPRLSVDIDMNYIGSADRNVMQKERPEVDQAIYAVCSRDGFSVLKSPDEHAGGKWQLRYESAMGQGGNLALDINYMLRIPLWTATRRDSHSIATYQAKQILVLDEHELAAGKLAALLARHTARDLFDAHQLLTQCSLGREQLRLAFLVYGGLNRIDWRTVTIESVKCEVRELESKLLPVLQKDVVPGTSDTHVWALKLIEECKLGLMLVLPLNDNEREFLDRLLDHGEIKPELLTTDEEMINRIARHPGLLWKAQNVRDHQENL